VQEQYNERSWGGVKVHWKGVKIECGRGRGQ